MKTILDMIVSDNILLSNNYCLIKLTHQEKLPDMLPGQFVQIRVDKSGSTFLRRPISVNFVDKDKNELWILIQIVGEGTRFISNLKKGEILSLVLPLGKSFSIPETPTSSLLIGGGVGIAPLLYLGKELKKVGHQVNFLLGFRTKDHIIELENFQEYGIVNITTEDGSFGEKGFVTNHSILNQNFDAIYTCGPKPMMLAVAHYAHGKKINCEVSLENMMACGFGACLCCVEKTIKGNLCACTEGPVFNLNQLTWIN